MFFFAVSRLEIKHKTRPCQGENLPIFVHKMYKEKCVEILNLQMRKNESTGWKALKQTFKFLNFWVCAFISLYTKLELIAMNKLGKVWFHSTFIEKFHGCSVRGFISFKQLFLNQFWITAYKFWAWLDNFKYQIVTLQN